MADRTVVFLGPTLDRDTAAGLLPAAEFRPPVRLGDVCAAVLAGFDTIVIIDGVFEQVPTVWHKEILWALSRGCAVYGASSMGALRAAELAPYGMCGVGEIYARFADGRYTDDDEVTVIHAADDDLGYRPLSTAMAAIRAAVEDAEAAGLCTAAQAAELVRRSKQRHYSQRCWPLVLTDAADLGLDVERLRALVRGPDAKATDATAALQRVAADLAAGTRPPAPPFDFEPTYNFEKLLTIVRAELAEQDVQREYGTSSAAARAEAGPYPLLHFLVDREARRLGLGAGDAGADQVRRLESYRRQLEQRHATELAMFTQTARLAMQVAGSGPAAEGLRAQDGNRLADGRVVR